MATRKIEIGSWAIDTKKCGSKSVDEDDVDHLLIVGYDDDVASECVLYEMVGDEPDVTIQQVNENCPSDDFVYDAIYLNDKVEKTITENGGVDIDALRNSFKLYKFPESRLKPVNNSPIE